LELEKLYTNENGQSTLHVSDVTKTEISQVQVQHVKVENVEVKLEHVGQPLGQSVNMDRGSDEFQYMSQECCRHADLPVKPCKKTEKLSSLSSRGRGSEEYIYTSSNTIKSFIGNSEVLKRPVCVCVFVVGSAPPVEATGGTLVA
jgi:hypothetical protein